MKANDYYEILELSPSASAEDVKRAYRRLAHKYHPDTGSSAPNDKSFNDICQAYEVLGNAESRRGYDLRYGLMAARREHLDKTRGQRTEYGSRGATPQASGLGDGVQLRTQVTLTRPGKRNDNGVSSTPHTFGSTNFHSDFDETEEQPKESFLQRLKGGVRTAFDRTAQTTTAPQTQSTLQESNLRGERVYRFTIDALESLQGTTREVALERGTSVRTVKVHIPVGVHGGDILTVPCPATSGFPAETIKVAIQIEPHPLLERDGLDLTVKLPITLGEAIKGAELQVPTIHGPLKVKIPPGWQESKRLRVKGKGLVHPSGTYQGDLFVKIYVVSPPSASAEALHLADAIDRLYTKAVRQDIPLSLLSEKN